MPRRVGRPRRAPRRGARARRLRRSERPRTVYVVGEGIPVRPLECEVIQTVGLAVVVRAHDARMANPRAVARLSQKPLHRRGVAPQSLPQYLERAGTALWVLGAIDFGRASLTDALEEAVAGDRPTGEVLAG